MLGNGSDELISLIAMACDVPGASILAPVPGFVMYAMSAQLQGLKFVGVPLTPDFELDEAAMLARDRRSTGRRSSTSPTRTTRPPTSGTTRVIDEDHRGRARPGGDRRGLPAVRQPQLHRPRRPPQPCAADAHPEQVRPGRRPHRLHDGPEGAGRGDRQGAPALQHQRAQLRSARCSRWSTPIGVRGAGRRSLRERARAHSGGAGAACPA